MRILLAVIFFVMSAAPLPAQLFAAQDGPVAMGHHHLNVTAVAAHQRFWGELLGGQPGRFGPIDIIKFPNALLFLRERAPEGGTRGTSVNHIGFQTPDLKPLLEKLKAAGVPIVTRQEVSGGRAKDDIFWTESQQTWLAFVLAPDDVKVELMENKSLDRPIVNHHIHFFTPDVAAAKQWYVETFDAEPGTRGMFEAADLPGVNLTFSDSEGEVAGTRGRSLDHIGFEVDNLEAFCKRLEAKGVKFDVPYREAPRLNLGIAFLTDPWGTYIELTEGLDRVQ